MSLFTRWNFCLFFMNVLLSYIYISSFANKDRASGIVGRLSGVMKGIGGQSFNGQCSRHEEGELPPLEPREWTLSELKECDGAKNGSYAKLAGRDATRALALQKVFDFPEAFTQSFDDYLDMTEDERKSVNEWVDFLYKKYPEVGILVRSKDDRMTAHKEDMFSSPGDPPNGGIFTDLKLN